VHHFEAEVTGCASERIELRHDQYRRCRPDEAEPLQVRHQLSKQSNTLLGHGFLAANGIHHVSGRIPARAHVALRKTGLDRVGGIRTEDHRQFGSDLVNGGGRGRRGDDDARLQCSQLQSEPRQAIEDTVGKAQCERIVGALGEARFLQALAYRDKPIVCELRGPRHKHGDKR